MARDGGGREMIGKDDGQRWGERDDWESWWWIRKREVARGIEMVRDGGERWPPMPKR